MMPRELGGVVDHNLIVYGTANVRVVDASVLPTQLCGHLTSTLYAVAEKISDTVKSKYRVDWTVKSIHFSQWAGFCTLPIGQWIRLTDVKRQGWDVCHFVQNLMHRKSGSNGSSQLCWLKYIILLPGVKIVDRMRYLRNTKLAKIYHMQSQDYLLTLEFRYRRLAGW